LIAVKIALIRISSYVCEHGLASGEPGYCESVVVLAAKCGCCPSRDGVLGVIGQMARPSLPAIINNNNKVSIQKQIK
jgi:hypothetical protein